jgi:two-component system NtrC family sensor kinase
VTSGDEVGALAQAFNRMTEDLRRAKENLLEWTWTLEGRVEERTRELGAMQARVARAEKLASLGQLAAGVAHEINNPLTSILLNAHLVLESRPPGDPAAEKVRLIAEETARCSRIVKGLLEFARQAPPERSPVDLNDLLERTAALLAGQAGESGIRIESRLDRSLPLLDLDPAQVQQVLWNLVLNACEAMPAGGTVTIESRRSADGLAAEVVVLDTGVGIPPENLGRVFDPFFTTKKAGTGLGLAVSYGLVEQHGGSIEVQSEAGRGSTFTIKWPLTDGGSR